MSIQDIQTVRSICELFGLNPHHVTAVDIALRLGEPVHVTAEMLAFDTSGIPVIAGQEMLTTTKTFTLTETAPR